MNTIEKMIQEYQELKNKIVEAEERVAAAEEITKFYINKYTEIGEQHGIKRYS